MCLDGINVAIQVSQVSFSNEFDEILLLHSLAHDLKQKVSAATHTAQRRLCPELLAKTWHIGLDAARRTLSTTTQESISLLEGKISRKVRTKAN